MIKLINRVTGTEMWVADDRLKKYLAAGHKPAGEAETEPTKEERPKKSRK